MRSSVQLARGVALMCSCLLISPPAFSQSQSLVKPAAENLFEEGRVLMQQQRYAEACTKFEASQGMDPGIGTILHLGDCYEKLGRTASAWATFKEAASLARLRAQEDRERIALTRAASLEQRLSRLSVRVPEAHRVDGLEVKLEGNAIPAASWNSPIPVDPGAVRVQASAPGRQTWNGTAQVAPEARDTSIEVPLLDFAPESAEGGEAADGDADATLTATGDRARAGNTQRTAGWIVGGAGVVGLGIGAFLGLRASSKNDESLDFCPNDDNRCTAEGVALRDDAKSYATMSTVGFAAGGALLATGLVLVLTAPKDRAARAAARFNVALDVQPRQGGLRVGGAF
ncbi:MAG TPA: tetratricopeptide repeat protein [Polyangiaceae bacterium]